MTSKFNELRLMARGIPPGTTDNSQPCPYCLGGPKGDKSFALTVKEDGTILFCCHRAKCGKQGAMGPSSGVAMDYPKVTLVQPEPPKRKPLTKAHEERIRTLYGINSVCLEEFGVCSVEEGDQVAIPVRDHTRRLRGWEYRQLPPYGPGPKSRSYRTTQRVWGCIYPAADVVEVEQGIVVVEDLWSAMKVAQECGEEFWSYALMGSHMSVEHVADISRFELPVYLCLDPDAQAKSIEYLKKYSHLFGNLMEVRLSNRDLKFYDRTELLSLLLDSDLPQVGGSEGVER